MKNFLSNRSLRYARVALTIITALLFATAIAGVAASGGGQYTQVASYSGTFLNVFLGVLAVAAITVAVLRYTGPERLIGLAFMSCVGISASITLDCPNKLVGGVNATFYIANKNDISTATDDGDVTVSNIVMKTGKKFFTVEGLLQSTDPEATMAKSKYINQFDHSVKFLIFKIDAEAKSQILKMKDGNFVCILENNFTGTDGDARYEVYGLNCGLKAEVITRKPNDTENLGAWSLELKTQEYARESTPPMTLYAGTPADTATLIATLLAPAA